MAQRLMDALVKALPAPAAGNRIHYDTDVKGFGVRVTKNGSRAFILNYRTRTGRERRYTIGNSPDWKTAAARDEARSLKQRIDRGEDPLAEVEADRAAPTVADMCQRFAEDHLPRLRPITARDYKAQIDRDILPVLGRAKVEDVTFSDVDALHRKITRRGSPYAANRTLALLSKMVSLAVRWGWRADNPCKGVERNQEQKRHRYLSGAELARLTQALAEHDDQQAADIVRLLLLTGCRRGEAMAARWDQIDLEAGIWTKPGSTTKQKTEHRVPLSAPARQLLARLQADADGADYVFAGRHGRGHRVEIKTGWAQLCRAAGITGARLHDLRHTYASVLASAGLSLPVIGALLGHSQPATTARYAHLFDDPLRAATERVGAIVMPGSEADIVPLRSGRGA